MSLLAFAVGLLGASSSFAQSDREARINDAIPLSYTAQNALVQMRRLVHDDELRATIEDELRTKMRLRALQCSQNFAISRNASSEDIRREHGGDPCFAEQDASIADWLGLHSVGALLARTPLRPISTGIANIADSQASIQQVYFAAHAGVALVLSYKDAEVMDLTRGVPILTALRSGYELINSISPNGWVYTANHGGRVRLYDAENGALLASPDGWYSGFGSGVLWLDARTALVYSSMPMSRGPRLYDFRTGESFPFDNDVASVARIAEVSSAPGTYVAFRNSGITKFRLFYQNGQPRAQILQVFPIRLNLIPNDNGGAVAGGRYFVNTSSGQLYLTSMDDLSTAPVDLGALEVQRAVPTADANRIIVAGYVRGGPSTWSFYEYALRERTLRPISTNSLPSTRFEYDPTHNVLFAISGSGLQRVDELSVGAIIDPKSLVALNGNAATTLQRHRFYALPPGAGVVTSHGMIQGFIPPTAAQPVPGPIADLAKDADIEGVGVYDAEEPGKTDETDHRRYIGNLEGTEIPMYRQSRSAVALKSERPATIDVTVDARRAPLILVLSSYASVRWRLSLTSGTNLTAVLLTGPHGSSVEGQGKARVVAIGGAYSYVLGSPEYGLLQNEVYTWTGKHISLFQCGKHASSFSIY